MQGAVSFLRFSLWQRMQHWLLVASFLALLATGLPQKFNDTGISVWVINTLGGVDQARFFHRIAASVFVFESFLHAGDIGLSIFRRKFRAFGPRSVPPKTPGKIRLTAGGSRRRACFFH